MKSRGQVGRAKGGPQAKWRVLKCGPEARWGALKCGPEAKWGGPKVDQRPGGEG